MICRVRKRNMAAGGTFCALSEGNPLLRPGGFRFTSGEGVPMSQSMTMPMQTPQDLFVHELSDMLSAEQIIVQMLEEAQGLVQNPQVKEGLRMHAEQSRQHAQRVQQVLQQVGSQPHPVQCH